MAAPFDPGALNRVFGELEAAARAQLAEEGFADADVELRRFADMKFNLQIHRVEVPVPEGDLGPAEAEAQVGAFVERYEEIYGRGSAFAGAGVQIGVLRVVARGRVRTPRPQALGEGAAARPASERPVWWANGGFRDTPVYDGTELGAGAAFYGPAVVEMPETTIVVPPGHRGRVDALGSFVISLDGGAS